MSSQHVDKLQRLADQHGKPGQFSPSEDASLYTPSNADQRLSAAHERRRMAYSDEPNLYNRPTVHPDNAPLPPTVTSGVGKSNWGYMHASQPLGNGFNLSTQHMTPQTHASYSMPRLPSQKPIIHVSDSFIAASHYDRNGNGMLNYIDQGTFHPDQNGDSTQSNIFDHYSPTPAAAAQNQAATQPQINPYSQDGNTMGSGAYFPGSTNYPQQVIWAPQTHC